jgi:hypothetical protein
MKALTPGRLTQAPRSLRLHCPAFPTFRPQPRGLSAGRFGRRRSARSCSRLRHRMSRLATDPRRNRFVILRTVGSSPVAPHPALLALARRSYLRLRSYDTLPHGLAPCRLGSFTDALMPTKVGIHGLPSDCNPSIPEIVWPYLGPISLTSGIIAHMGSWSWRNARRPHTAGNGQLDSCPHPVLHQHSEDILVSMRDIVNTYSALGSQLLPKSSHRCIPFSIDAPDEIREIMLSHHLGASQPQTTFGMLKPGRSRGDCGDAPPARTTEARHSRQIPNPHFRESTPRTPSRPRYPRQIPNPHFRESTP